jgi:hypothetical protein
MAIVPFAIYASDRPALSSAGTTPYVNNVVTQTDESYGPIKAPVRSGNALTARAQGARSFRGTNGTIETFVGDATNLYRWDGSAWSDISRLAGDHERN